PRRAFGVVLDGLDRLLAMAEALDRAVVEIDLADPEPGRDRQRRPDDLDLVILGRHLDDPEFGVLDWMVRPVVTEPESGRIRTRRPADDLMTKTDAEQGSPVVDDRLCQGDGTVESSRIPRAWRQDQA